MTSWRNKLTVGAHVAAFLIYAAAWWAFLSSCNTGSSFSWHFTVKKKYFFMAKSGGRSLSFATYPKDTEMLFPICACSHLFSHLEATACRLPAEDKMSHGLRVD